MCSQFNLRSHPMRLISNDKWDERVFRKSETVSHEDDKASPHRGSSTQTVQERADDRQRSW
jgi:hypothetical protein